MMNNVIFQTIYLYKEILRQFGLFIIKTLDVNKNRMIDLTYLHGLFYTSVLIRLNSQGSNHRSYTL